MRGGASVLDEVVVTSPDRAVESTQRHHRDGRRDGRRLRACGSTSRADDPIERAVHDIRRRALCVEGVCPPNCGRLLGSKVLPLSVVRPERGERRGIVAVERSRSKLGASRRCPNDGVEPLHRGRGALGFGACGTAACPRLRTRNGSRDGASGNTPRWSFRRNTECVFRRCPADVHIAKFYRHRRHAGSLLRCGHAVLCRTHCRSAWTPTAGALGGRRRTGECARVHDQVHLGRLLARRIRCSRAPNGLGASATAQARGERRAHVRDRIRRDHARAVVSRRGTSRGAPHANSARMASPHLGVHRICANCRARAKSGGSSSSRASLALRSYCGASDRAQRPWPGSPWRRRPW